MKVLNYEGLQLYHELASEEFANAAEVQTALEVLEDGKVDKDGSKVLSTNDYTTAEKNKLAGIASGAEVNQNAFSNVVVGSTTISADSKTDTLTIAAGSNITLTPDASGDKITIASKNTTYSDATTTTSGLMSASDKLALNNAVDKLNDIEEGANNYSLPTASSSVLGGVKIGNNISVSSGTISLSKANVTNALGYTPSQTDTTYSNATTTSAGLMSANDKLALDNAVDKLNNIEEEANNYSHPSYTSQASGLYKITVDGLGHVSKTSSVTKSDITALGIPAQDTTYSTATNSSAGLMSADDKAKLETAVDKLSGIEANANKTVVDSALSSTSTNPVQNKVVNSALSGKQGTITGAASTVTSSDLTKNKALVSNSNGKIAVSSVSSTELGYLAGVTSSIQTQFSGINDNINDLNSNKVDKVDGMGLSSNNFTTDYITKINNATTKLSGIADGANKTTVDSTLSSTSTNPVQNKVINSALSNKVDKVSGKGLSTKDFTQELFNKLDGISSGAQVNQNAFSNITDGTTTIAADSATDTLTLAAGSNISLALDATNDKVTISATNTTYGAAGSSLGLVKSGGDVTISNGEITVKNDSHSHSNYVTNTAFETLEDKVDAIGKVVDIVAEDPDDDTIDRISEIVGYIEDNKEVIDIITDKQDKNLGSSAANKVLVTDGSGNIASSSITTTKLGYLSDVTSSIQGQLNTLTDRKAFSTVGVKASSTATATNIAADTSTDTLTFVAGSNITLTPDANNDVITIAAKDTTYGTAGSSLGLVKTTSSVTDVSGYTPVPIVNGIPYYKDTNNTYTLGSFGITASAENLNHTAGATSNIQGQLNNLTDRKAFSTIGVKTSSTATATNIAADSASDTVTFIAGSNVTLTPDTTNDTLTISATNTTYSGAGDSLGLVKTGGNVTISNGIITVKDNGHSHSIDNVTGLATALDEKLTAEDITVSVTGTGNAITGASYDNKGTITLTKGTAYTLPTAGSTLGGVKTTSTVTDASGYTPVPIIGGVPYYKDTNTTYSAATTSAAGLMSATDKSNLNNAVDKLSGIAAGANKYSHPTHTSKTSGLYKITVDGLGHVSSATAVSKTDITDLGIPAQDTTYSAATTTTDGLMSAADKTNLNNAVDKLSGIATGANKTVVDTALSSSSTNPVQNKVINSALSGKENTISLTANRALVSNASGKVAVSSVTSTELGYLSGVTSSVQTQFNNINDTLAGAITGITAGTGLSGGGTSGALSLSLATSGVTAGTYGPSAAVTGNNNTTMNVPEITVDAYGRVTKVTNRVYTAKNNTYTIPTTLKNPNALTIYGNATKCYDYDGSAAKTLTIKPGSNITVTGDTSGNITIANTYSYSLPTAGSSLGGVKTTSTVTSTSGLTACPIISGVVYYKDTDTNTHYTTRLYAGASGTAANAAATNPYLKVTDDNTYRNQIQFKGGGATTVSSDANGVITISSTDTNTNTDTKVTQGRSTSSSYRPLLMHYTYGEYGADVGQATNTVYYNETISAKASTGEIKATSFVGSGASLTSLNASNISSGTIAAARLPAATSSAYGAVKIGYTQSGKNYPVQLSNGQMYVNVPWTDNNTTYTFTNKAATLSWNTTSTIATVGGVDITVKMPANPNTNTTYSAGTGLTLSETTFSLSTVPITSGGTGATSKSGARTNLGIDSGTSLPASGTIGDIFFLYS